MINIRTILKLKENDGLTLKNGKAITYKTGYQVATEGIATSNPYTAINMVKFYGGNCGIWFAKNNENEIVYYIDKSQRVNTKKEAFIIGKQYNQISIYAWKNIKQKLLYL